MWMRNDVEDHKTDERIVWQIGESGVRAVCEALTNNGSLTNLSLHTCELGDKGCEQE